MKKRYTVTIKHHSIARARTIKVVGTLIAAKRAATKEFGAEQMDYEIVICDDRGIVASRMVGETRWS